MTMRHTSIGLMSVTLLVVKHYQMEVEIVYLFGNRCCKRVWKYCGCFAFYQI